VPGRVHQPWAAAHLIGGPLGIQRDRDLPLLEQQAEVEPTNTGTYDSDISHGWISLNLDDWPLPVMTTRDPARRKLIPGRTT
jgi:hypothetical protein